MTINKKDPLHGITLEAILNHLADSYGWEELGTRININCFNVDPSVSSSLRFLRKTPWARTKVESFYLYTLRKQRQAKALEEKSINNETTVTDEEE